MGLTQLLICRLLLAHLKEIVVSVVKVNIMSLHALQNYCALSMVCSAIIFTLATDTTISGCLGRQYQQMSSHVKPMFMHTTEKDSFINRTEHKSTKEEDCFSHFFSIVTQLVRT